MNLRLKVYGFSTLVLILALSGYFLKQRRMLAGTAGNAAAAAKNGAKKADEGPPAVEIAVAKRGPISSYISSTANLRALREVLLASQAEGVVRTLLVEEGAFVETGQPLCRLDDRRWQIDLQLAREKLAQARLQLERAKIRQEKSAVQTKNTALELRRQELAFKEGLASEQDVAAIRYRLEELQHDERAAGSETVELAHRLEELEAEIAKAQLQITLSTVTAPFAGYITERRVELGQTVRNLDPLFRLAAFSPLFADTHLSEQEASRVRPGQPATISLGSGERDQVQGRVSRINPAVDPATGTVKVTIEVAASQGNFKPGAFVRVEIQTDTRQEAILVPKRAVLERDGQRFVFITKGDKAHRSNVTLGYENDREVEVRLGVAVGDNVIVAGQGNLKDGDAVRQVSG